MHLIESSNVKQIASEIGLNPSKNKGQNFLIDVEKAKNIANLLKNDENSKVLEIGPGLGSLTYHLLDRCKNLSVIDIDPNVISYLKSFNDNFTIIEQDALTYDLKGYEYIISNIPYSITAPLMEHMLLSGVDAKQFVLMMQKENYTHFHDVSGKEYGPLSVLVHLVGNIKKQFDVGSSSFYPMPKCTSTVFTIDVNLKCSRDELYKAYKSVCSLFNNRRKTILNNLSNIINKDKAKEILNKAGILPSKRPEEISPEQFLLLSRIIVDEKQK